MHSHLSGIVAPLLLLLPFAAAQADSLSGRVLDPSGSAVSNARIRIFAGNETYTADSGAEGTYSFNMLSEGKYTLRAEATGFQPFETQVIVNFTLSGG